MHRRRLIAYAGMAMPLAFLGLPLYVYVPATYAQLPAIGLTMTGLVLFGARLLDLLTDPAAGLLLDRWRYRVHPFVWMLIGAPLLGAGASWLFTPPPDAGALYLLLTVSLTYAGWTLVAVPYFAWGAELAETPSDHRRVATWREAGSVLGAVAALLLTAAAARDALPVLRDAMLWLLALALLMLVGVPRRPMANGIVGVSWTELWRHTPSGMRRLLGLHLLNATAASMPATLFVLYAAQVLQLSERHTGILLLLYFLSAVAALPLWLALARRVGESDTWLLAILLCAVAFLPAAFLGTGVCSPVRPWVRISPCRPRSRRNWPARRVSGSACHVTLLRLVCGAWQASWQWRRPPGSVYRCCPNSMPARRAALPCPGCMRGCRHRSSYWWRPCCGGNAACCCRPTSTGR